MANLVGAYTALTPRGTPGQVSWAETGNTPRAYTEDFTAMLPWGVPGRLYGDFTKVVASTVALTVSDTASLSATEEPIDRNEIATTDTARLSASDVSQLFNRIDVTDTATLSAGETIALLQSGVTLKTASDTASLSATEVTTVGVTVSVSDTASLTVTDTSAVAVSSETINVSDTASLSADDAQLLGIFTGIVEQFGTDTAFLVANDSAAVIEVRRITRIALDMRTSHITLEIL